MKIYVIRHGQTDWNVAGKCQGRTDIELNETGIEQAKQAKEQLKNYNIEQIICSPLKRTIIERECGTIEGTTRKEWNDIVKNDISIINNYNLNYNEHNIEPIQDVCKRVWNLLDEIKEKYKDRNVLIVTHGGTCRAINAYFNGIEEDGNIPSANIKNCEIREYEYK